MRTAGRNPRATSTCSVKLRWTGRESDKASNSHLTGPTDQAGCILDFGLTVRAGIASYAVHVELQPPFQHRQVPELAAPDARGVVRVRGSCWLKAWLVSLAAQSPAQINALDLDCGE
jgi:hypothetical protein